MIYKIILKINHYIFRRYYKKVAPEFRKYTFFKSLKLFVEYTNNEKISFKKAQEHIFMQHEDINSLLKENSDLKLENALLKNKVDTFSIKLN